MSSPSTPSLNSQGLAIGATATQMGPGNSNATPPGPQKKRMKTSNANAVANVASMIPPNAGYAGHVAVMSGALMNTGQPMSNHLAPGGLVTGYTSAAASAAAGNQPLVRPDTIEELEWIDRCKRTIGNKVTYNEFLKVLNLFSQEIIDAKTLVERVEPFLSKAPELFEWFKRFVKYEENQV
ncbi:Transcriptional regulatory protein sin3, partial [Cladochytrium tenue]